MPRSGRFPSVIAAIMQPYFFPYIGYFQLMKAVDVFVFYDDAQYMKGGWINRNRILVNGGPSWLTLPIRRASVTLPINQRHYLLDGGEISAIQQRLRDSYEEAPAYVASFPMLSELLNFEDSNVAAYNKHLLAVLASRLDIKCRFVASSELDKTPGLKGQQKVVDICRRLGITHYINSIGGLDLYDPQIFRRAGIELSFLRARPVTYTQAGQPHVPFLAIIDVLMFNSFEQTKPLLNEFDSIAPCSVEQQ
jgi:hypothetical protein